MIYIFLYSGYTPILELFEFILGVVSFYFRSSFISFWSSIIWKWGSHE